jgi:hypothetical protein
MTEKEKIWPKRLSQFEEALSGPDEGQFWSSIRLHRRTHGFPSEITGRPAAVGQPIGQAVVLRHQPGDKKGWKTDREANRETGRVDA